MDIQILMRYLARVTMTVVLPAVVGFITLLVSGFCGMMVWNWFVPVFFASIPSLSFVAATCVVLIVTVFVPLGTFYNFKKIINNPDMFMWNSVLNQVMDGICRPVSILIFVWVIYTFCI